MSHDMQILAARGEASSANGNGAAFGATIRRGAQVVATGWAEAETETTISLAMSKAKEEPKSRQDGEDEGEEPVGHEDGPNVDSQPERVVVAEAESRVLSIDLTLGDVRDAGRGQRQIGINRRPELDYTATRDELIDSRLLRFATKPDEVVAIPVATQPQGDSRDPQNQRSGRGDVERPAANDRE
jgi:hypothetical protein